MFVSEYAPPPPLENKENLKIEESLKPLIEAGVFQPIPAVRVKNKVNYVKMWAQMGKLDFAINQSTSYAYQVALGGLARKPDTLLYCRIGHHRAGIITAESTVEMPTENGQQRYPYIDQKPIGFVITDKRDISGQSERDTHFSYYMSPNQNIAHISPQETQGSAMPGLIKTGIINSREFERLNIRTVPIIACTDLLQLVTVQGEKVGLERAKDLELIFDYQPVASYRGWITPHRVSDTSTINPINAKLARDKLTTKDIERKKFILMSALKDIQIDKSIPQKVRTQSLTDVETYLEWFAETIGENLGRMHGNGYAHGFLAALHNFTLDARIIDLDGVRLIDENKAYEKEIMTNDYLNVFSPYAPLYNDFLKIIPQWFGLTNVKPEQLLELAEDTYHDELRITKVLNRLQK